MIAKFYTEDDEVQNTESKGYVEACDISKKIVSIQFNKDDNNEVVHTDVSPYEVRWYRRIQFFLHPESPSHREAHYAEIVPTVLIKMQQGNQRFILKCRVSRFFIKSRRSYEEWKARRHEKGFFILPTVMEIDKEYVDWIAFFSYVAKKHNLSLNDLLSKIDRV